MAFLWNRTCFNFVSFVARVTINYFYRLSCYHIWYHILMYEPMDFSGSKFVSLVSLLFHLEPGSSGLNKKVIVTKCFTCRNYFRAWWSGGWKKTGFSKSVCLFWKMDIYKCPKIKSLFTFKPRKVADFSHL